MNDFPTVLRRLRADAKISRARLGEKIGTSKTAIKNWEDGVHVPRLEHLKSIAEYFKIDVNDLYVLNANPNKMKDYQQFTDWDDDTPLDDDEVAVPFYKNISIACGTGSVCVIGGKEDRRLHISKATLRRISATVDEVFAIKADGNSMSPIIDDGDTLWIDKSKRNVKDGRIFIFQYGGLCMCKRLYLMPNNGLRVVSDNVDEYKEFIISADEIIENEFIMIGWVFNIQKMLEW